MNLQKTPNKAPLSDYRNFLINQIKSSDLDRLNLDDEARYRLSALNYFTAFQAEQWIISYPNLCEEKALLDFLIQKEIPVSQEKPGDFAALFNMARLYFKDEHTLDGVNQETFIKGLNEGATLETIRECALFYGLNIPRRIKKAELVQIIHERSNQDFSLESLNKMSVLELEMLSKENQYNVSIELKKIEMIYYLIDHLKQSPPLENPSQDNKAKKKSSSVILNLTTQEFLSRNASSSSKKYALIGIIFLSIFIYLFMFYL
jgi:hypothetical protein